MRDIKNPLFDLTNVEDGEAMGPTGSGDVKTLHPFFPLTDLPAVSVAVLLCGGGGPVTLGVALLFVLIFSGILEKLLKEEVEHVEKPLKAQERGKKDAEIMHEEQVRNRVRAH